MTVTKPRPGLAVGGGRATPPSHRGRHATAVLPTGVDRHLDESAVGWISDWCQLMQTIRDTIRYRHVLFALTGKELKAQYRNSALGFAWALLNPLVMIAVLSTVFIVVWEAGLDQPSMVVTGLIPFNFMSYCISGCAGAILTNSTLIKKVRFPRQILPYSVILTHLVHFAIQSTLIVLVLAIFPAKGGPLSWHLLWLPLIVAIQVAFCVGAGMLVSALNVVFRDTQYVVASALTVLFWASPVLYEANKFFGDEPSTLRVAYLCNPMAGIIDSYRSVLYRGEAPDALALGLATFMTVIVGIAGFWVFWKYEREFAEYVR